MSPDRLLISPGPCYPARRPASPWPPSVHFAGRIPVLGVCLGHQSIGEAFGGKVVRAGRLMHGKTSPIHHDGRGVFTGLPTPFDGMRYHSLVVEESCSARLSRSHGPHRSGRAHGPAPQDPGGGGVQFHPEIDHDPGRGAAPAQFYCTWIILGCCGPESRRQGEFVADDEIQRSHGQGGCRPLTSRERDGGGDGGDHGAARPPRPDRRLHHRRCA